MIERTQAGIGGPSLRGVVEERARLLRAVRGYFEGAGFCEVETPLLYPGRDLTVALDDFVTVYRGGGSTDVAGEVRLSLPTSPEFYMKRLLARLAREAREAREAGAAGGAGELGGSGEVGGAAGVPSLFQIVKFFRNGEATRQHNPEFTGLEFYEPGVWIDGLLARTEGVLLAVATAFGVGEAVTLVDGGRCRLDGGFERVRYADACRELAGVDPLELSEMAAHGAAVEAGRRAAEVARGRGVRVPEGTDWRETVERLYVALVQPALGRERPCFLTHFLAADAALARLDADDRRVALRAELFVGGLELGNGFVELADVDEQRARFVRDGAEKTARTGEAHLPDEPFLADLVDLPACGGMAMGLDRVLMAVTGRATIGEVLAFSFVDEVRAHGLCEVK